MQEQENLPTEANATDSHSDSESTFSDDSVDDVILDPNNQFESDPE